MSDHSGQQTDLDAEVEIQYSVVNNLNIKISVKELKQHVSQFKYLAETIHHMIQEEIKRSLNSDNACYHSCPEYKLRVFEDRVLRIFGPKRDGVEKTA
jgi:hypothetical protein